MKNKLRMIDINVASSYMGKFLTLGVTAAVLAITVSAMYGPGGFRNHRPLLIEVPASGGAERYRPLRDLIAIETGRSVMIRVRGEQSCEDCDLYVFPIEPFLSQGSARGLTPLYAVEPIGPGRNAAVLIARRAAPPPDSPPAAEDVIFSHERSLNGFWVQLSLLEAEGFTAPGGLGSLRFASTPGAGTRVVYSVALGQSALGACRASDLTEAVRSGGIGGDELTIVRSSPALPELVVAGRPSDAAYLAGVLERIAAALLVEDSAGRRRAAVRMMKIEGMRRLRPVERGELEKAAELYSQMKVRLGHGGP